MAAYSPRCRAITEFLTSIGEPEFRIRQVLHGVYKAHAYKWHKIEGVPTGLKWKLKDRFGKYVLNFQPAGSQEGDQAHKVMLKSFKDQTRVEAVSLAFRSHRSLCISSQVGCAFQCAFCATGRIGLKRQLDADEIADQVLYFMQLGQKIDSVSFMGMGEPLANPKVYDALRVLTSPELVGMSTRRMVVSTVGVIPGILKLTEEMPQVNLVFSLHSPFTEERDRLVPLNKMYPMKQVFETIDMRIRKTGRRVWVCYLMLQGQNDTEDHAKALVQWIKDRPSETRYLYHINLLPYNIGRSVPEHFARADVGGVEKFQKVIAQSGISCSYRNSFGSKIDAACGQLYADYEDKLKGMSLSARPPARTKSSTAESAST
eukprot:TRINITY_DN37425_c0_g1_i1.p1 TRINITY_DN37425_c0_g1~~TRINITY_DN37425_c0_g1_i1.p1  ORF type:complete len:373 (-),score=67.40 TRINITY_DN37425_c0_g1_i1:455-1573(-)